jgi:small ligand-binding sensory domain FIST
MPVSVGVGLSDEPEGAVAFAAACEQAAEGLDGACDLAIMFATASHLEEAQELLALVDERLSPSALIGCGAGGVLAAGRELERGSGAAVWALSAPDAGIATHHFETESVTGELRPPGPQAELGESLVVLCDPRSFNVDALLAHLNETSPGMPVLGGLASVAGVGAPVLFRDGEPLTGGAVACSFSGLGLIPCVSQGATPVGPEMTITAASGNVIAELASRPALERLREAIVDLPEAQRRLAAQGLMLGIVIDDNQPEYERGDFLVRPIIGADPERGSIAVGEDVRVGQAVRMQVRDGATADEDLRGALRMQAAAIGAEGAAGALVFTCNGRGSSMFDIPDHDAGAVDDALGAPAAGFFCAGEIGPVGGRNFLHGFTATIAVFPRGR